MADAITFLTSIGILLLIGIVGSIISSKLNIPNLLILIIVGMIIARIPYKGGVLISFPPVFITSISILALVMIVFDATSQLDIKELEQFSFNSIKITLIAMALNAVVLALATSILFGIPGKAIPLVFATLMSGTDPAAVMALFKKTTNKVIELIKIEAITNTPLMVLIPFMILDVVESIKPVFTVAEFLAQSVPFLQQIVTGIGSGMLVGILIFKLMRKRYSERLSPVAIITAALITYLLAEQIGGNGVLAVTTLGVFYARIYVKEKAQLLQFSAMFASSLEILVFVMVGLTITIPFTGEFLLKSFILFLVFLLMRWTATYLSLREYSWKEKLFIALNSSKGIAVAVVVLTLSTAVLTYAGETTPFIQLPGAKTILDLSLIFMLYSIILSTIITRFSKKLINIQAGEAEL